MMTFFTSISAIVIVAATYQQMVKQAADAAMDRSTRSRFSGTGDDMATEINFTMNGKKTAVKYGEEGELGESKLDKKAIKANESFLKTCFKLQNNFSFNEKTGNMLGYLPHLEREPRHERHDGETSGRLEDHHAGTQ